jgi:hypothetical protein
MSHFEERFYDLLILISSDQDTARWLADGIDILEDYHLARSFRRGATTRATNAGVKEDDIDWLCRWNDTARWYANGIDILEDYHLARSFRRGATTRATNAGVKEDDMDWLCRWNTGGEQTGGAPLRVLYSDRTQLLETYLRFSLAL